MTILDGNKWDGKREWTSWEERDRVLYGAVHYVPNVTTMNRSPCGMVSRGDAGWNEYTITENPTKVTCKLCVKYHTPCR